MAKTGVIGLCCISLLPSIALAERSSFYSIVGPDGHLMIVDRNAPVASTDQQAQAVNKPSRKWNLFRKSKPQVQESSQKTLNQDSQSSLAVTPVSPVKTSKNVVTANQIPSLLPTTQITTTANIANTKPSAGQQIVQGQSVVKPDLAQTPVQVVDGQEYIDSEYLEQREFNLEGKKRFYNLPDGLGGTQVVQREKGLDMSIFRGLKVKPKQPEVVTLAKDYQRLTRDEIVQLTGMQCFSQQQLKKAKVLKPDEAVNFWPKPGFEPKFDFVVAQLNSTLSDVEITSYADNMQNPQFYWPLPIFLNDKGCVIEGVNAFYQRKLPATGTSHQGLQGYLHLPEQTRYILFTPLESAADLSQEKLTNSGQIRLAAVR